MVSIFSNFVKIICKKSIYFFFQKRYDKNIGKREGCIMEYLLQKGPLTIRRAERSDVPVITQLIRGLAEYEHMPECCFVTDALLEASIFDRGEAKVLIAEYNGKPAGFSLYFYNYSTWLARKGLYLEDLFVRPEMRGKGIGKCLLQTLARIAVEEGCGRFEWSCLDWNEPSIAFYKCMGAEPMSDWTMYRVTGDALTKLAGEE